MTTRTIFSTTLILLACAATTSATAQDAVRAWGMGGAGCAVARGLGAVAHNPANLAFSEGTSVGLASAALDVHNNALSLDHYNEITGAHLDAAAKDRLLSEIPDGGLLLDADATASALGYHQGSLAFSFGAMGAGRGNLDRDYFDLVLYGNGLDETIDFSNTWGDGYAVGAATLSYGRVFTEVQGAQLSAGVNVRFLQGIYEMHVEEAYGRLSTDLTAVSGEAYLATRSAAGGQGYGIDVGFALQAPGGVFFGLTLDNLYSQLAWDREVENREFRVTADDFSLLADDLDATVADADTTYAGEAYNTNLPRRVRLGAAKRMGSFLLAADYTQGFTDRSGNSRQPRLQTGVEWRLAHFIQPRAGLTLGGGADASAAAGLGLLFGPWRLDLAAVGNGGLQPGSHKGLGVAVGSSLVF